MTITDHYLDGANKSPIPGGADMSVRRCLVIHFTSGATAQSSVESMASRGLAAHLVIDRDGTIYQCRAFNRECGHAGVSRWKDPKTDKLYVGLNHCAIGIELANAGNDGGVIDWSKKKAGATVSAAKHRNGGKMQNWEEYPQAQLDACFSAAKAIVEKYNLDDVTGHDCIAPERKEDPGPLFPMQKLREFCGFQGLPVVHWP